MNQTRPETYWTTRNALVDTVSSLSPDRQIAESRVYCASSDRTRDEQEIWDRYTEALDSLKSFDAIHGGAPIL